MTIDEQKQEIAMLELQLEAARQRLLEAQFEDARQQLAEAERQDTTPEGIALAVAKECVIPYEGSGARFVSAGDRRGWHLDSIDGRFDVFTKRVIVPLIVAGINRYLEAHPQPDLAAVRKAERERCVEAVMGFYHKSGVWWQGRGDAAFAIRALD